MKITKRAKSTPAWAAKRLKVGNWVMLLSRLKDLGYESGMTAEELAAIESPALLREFELFVDHLSRRGY